MWINLQQAAECNDIKKAQKFLSKEFIQNTFLNKKENREPELKLIGDSAIKWYTKAAEQGDADAQFNLGLMYHYGQGVVENHTEAVKWYEKAAKQGLASAQNNLGVMYEQGQGVVENHTEALKYFKLAATQGHKNAKQMVKMLSAEPGIFRRSMNWVKGLF